MIAVRLGKDFMKSKEILKKKFKAIWNPKRKLWYVDATPEEILEALHGYEYELVSESLITLPHESKLFPFQHEGVAHLVEHKVAVLSDPMGAGKTVQAITAALKRGAKVVTVVCPKNIKFNWEMEIKKWVSKPVYRIDSKDELPYKQQDIKQGFYLLHYDIFSSIRRKGTDKDTTKQYMQRLYTLFICSDVVIFDEAHYIKNPRAKRTRVIRNILKVTPGYKWFLTGTFVDGKAENLLGLLKTIWPKENWDVYFIEVPIGAFNKLVLPKSNAKSLFKKLLQLGFLHRDKDEILSQLPPKRRIPYYVTRKNVLESFEARLQEYLSQSITELPYDIIRMILDDSSKGLEVSQIAQKLADMLGGKAYMYNAIIMKTMMLARKVAWDWKKEAVFDLILRLLEEYEHLVVFAGFKESVADIRDFLDANSISNTGFTGDTPIHLREKAIHDFNNGKKRVFVATIHAGNVGINLTRANCMVMAELVWELHKILQAEDRIHRIGQTKNVLIYYPIVPNSFEYNILRTLNRKNQLTNNVLNTNHQFLNLNG